MLNRELVEEIRRGSRSPEEMLERLTGALRGGAAGGGHNFRFLSLWTFRCRNPDGSLAWWEAMPNLVPTVGLNKVLDALLVTGEARPTFSGESLGTPNGATTSFSHTLTNHANVDPGSCVVTYTISAVVHTVTDSGNGTFPAASGFTSGTINYATGAVALTFSSAPDNATTLTAAYTQEFAPLWYVGLIEQAGAPTFVAGDTMGSHPGWTEINSVKVTNVTRPAWTPGSISGGSVNNLSSQAVYTIASMQSGTLQGGFMVDNNTLDGTSGTLLTEAAFVQGSQSVTAGQIINVGVTITATSA